MSDFQISGTTLKKYTGKDKVVHIPEGVQTIESFAFYESKITEVFLPSSVKSIESEAFVESSSLCHVHLNEGLARIDDCAFKDTSLMEISMPDTLTLLGWSVFQNTKIQKVDFSKNLEYIPVQCFADTPLKRIVIPDTISEIEASAFENCKKLEEVYMPKSLTSFGYSDEYFGFTFAHCEKLRKITIPKGVNVIYEGMFTGCTSLCEVTFKTDFLHHIDHNAFANCQALKTITIPRCDSIDKSVFYPISTDTKIFLDDKTYQNNMDFVLEYPGCVFAKNSIEGLLQANKSLKNINEILIEKDR